MIPDLCYPAVEGLGPVGSRRMPVASERMPSLLYCILDLICLSFEIREAEFRSGLGLM